MNQAECGDGGGWCGTCGVSREGGEERERERKDEKEKAAFCTHPSVVMLLLWWSAVAMAVAPSAPMLLTRRLNVAVGVGGVALAV